METRGDDEAPRNTCNIQLNMVTAWDSDELHVVAHVLTDVKVALYSHQWGKLKVIRASGESTMLYSTILTVDSKPLVELFRGWELHSQPHITTVSNRRVGFHP